VASIPIVIGRLSQRHELDESRKSNEIPQQIYSVESRDINDDGRPDIVMKGKEVVYLSFGRPDGTYSPSKYFATESELEKNLK